MNKKAELFQAYLQENKITCFTVEEVQDDPLNSVVFRSLLEVDRQRLPVIVILDSSIYCVIRVLVAPRVMREDNEVDILRELDRLNRSYKAFKYYLDEEGSIILDCSILFRNGQTDGGLIYTMFDVMIRNLTSEYKKLMQLSWK